VNYVSVCSGIEAATVAWHSLGWNPLAFAEIAPFPSKVLAHHYPQVPNVGDFTTIPARSDCDLLVGGTPCQSFSIAGLRGGLGDSRGNLALEFMRLADRLRPRWILWENVPGVLSSNGGRDFGSILGALAELGYGFSWRVLDAQFFGVPQRRRRVFVVGYLGDWRPAAAVFSERTSLRRDTPSRRTKRDQVAGTLGAGTHGGFGGDLDRCGAFVPVGVRGDVAHTLRAEGCDASEDGTGRGTPIVTARGVGIDGSPDLAHCLRANPSGADKPSSRTYALAWAENSRGEVRSTGDITGALSTGDITGALSTGGGKPGQGYPAIAFHATQDPISGEVSPALSARGTVGVTGQRVGDLALTCHAVKGGDPTTDNYTVHAARVRKLTPRECERLQGFPDDYTLIDGAADTPRYHALGNSMAVPVMRWIGKWIDFIDRHLSTQE